MAASDGPTKEFRRPGWSGTVRPLFAFGKRISRMSADGCDSLQSGTETMDDRKALEQD